MHLKPTVIQRPQNCRRPLVSFRMFMTSLVFPWSMVLREIVYLFLFLGGRSWGFSLFLMMPDFGRYQQKLAAVYPRFLLFCFPCGVRL